MRTKDDIKSYRRKYYEKHKPQYLAYTRKRRAVTNAERRERYASDPHFRESVKARVRVWKGAMSSTEKRARRYGLDTRTLEEMVRDGCEVCGAHDEFATLVIDHDHATGAVRGVLCDCCNRGLGFFYDDPMTLAAASAYLLRCARKENAAC